jgi:hypothetical protein
VVEYIQLRETRTKKKEKIKIMTTVAQLIEFLKTQDQDAEVHVVSAREVSYQGYDVDFAPLDLKEDVNYIDFRGNPHILPSQPGFGKSYLELGDIY